MQTKFFNMTKKIIGLYQLITGVMGAIIIFASLLNTSAAKVALPQKVAGVVLFGLLAWAGYGLINKKRNALKYSRILQALQVISFSIGGTLYKFTAAGFIALGIKNGSFTWGISAQPIDFAITSIQNTSFSLIVYLVPLLILIGLLRVK